MDWKPPEPAALWHAIELYLQCAYPPGKVPSAVKGRLEALRAATPAELYDSAVFEKDDADAPSRLNLRLGNLAYPHMKLVIQRSPAGVTYLLRADTHDRHIRPAPGSRDYDAFTTLMQSNQQYVEQIEAAWDKASLPTFKQYLREDLARRQGAQ